MRIGPCKSINECKCSIMHICCKSLLRISQNAICSWRRCSLWRIKRISSVQRLTRAMGSPYLRPRPSSEIKKNDSTSLWLSRRAWKADSTTLKSANLACLMLNGAICMEMLAIWRLARTITPRLGRRRSEDLKFQSLSPQSCSWSSPNTLNSGFTIRATRFSRSTSSWKSLPSAPTAS